MKWEFDFADSKKIVKFQAGVDKEAKEQPNSKDVEQTGEKTEQG